MTQDELKQIQTQNLDSTHTNDNSDEFPKAPDGGWVAWMVVVGCFFIHIISKILKNIYCKWSVNFTHVMLIRILYRSNKKWLTFWCDYTKSPFKVENSTSWNFHPKKERIFLFSLSIVTNRMNIHTAKAEYKLILTNKLLNFTFYVRLYWSHFENPTNTS